MPQPRKQVKQVHLFHLGPAYTSLKKKPLLSVLLLFILLILCILAIKGYRQYQTYKSFRHAEQRITATLDSLGKMADVSLAKTSDVTKTCYKRAPEEFSKKVLFCDINVDAYYEIDNSTTNREATLEGVKKAVEYQFGVSLERADFAKDNSTIEYLFGARSLKQFGSLSCGIDIKYPVTQTVPATLQGQLPSPVGKTMRVNIDCDSQTTIPIYPVVPY